MLKQKKNQRSLTKVKKLPSIKPGVYRVRRMEATETLRKIFRMFIAPFWNAWKHFGWDDMLMSEAIRKFFGVDEVTITFSKALKDMTLPGEAWAQSPHYPKIKHAPRNVKKGDVVTTRADYKRKIFEVEFNEIVFQMTEEQFNRIARKLSIVC